MNSKVRGLGRWLVRRRLIVVPLVVVSAVVVPVSGGNSGSIEYTAPRVLLMLLLVVAAAFSVVRVGAMLSGVDSNVQVLAEHLASDPGQQRLLARWMSRARWMRNVGGLSGLLLWAFGTNGHGDLLLCGVGGIALGAMAAELHYIKPTKGPRTASLAARSIDDYLLIQDKRRMVAIAAAAAIAATLGFVLRRTATAGWWALAALVVLVAVRSVQQRVATRPRPAIGLRMQAADDLARELSIGRGLARPGEFFALAMVAVAVGELRPAIGGVGSALKATAWLYALYLWWHNRRLGLDFVLDRSVPVLA